MQIFIINNKITIDCKSKENKKGFQHIATLKLDGLEALTSRIQYYNRTWESYEYKSVLKQLADRIEFRRSHLLSKKELKLLKDFIKNPKRVEDSLKPLRDLGKIAKISEIFGDDLKGKNARKVRILKQGLGESFMLPDDWNSLSEEVKAKRLDGAIGQLRK